MLAKPLTLLLVLPLILFVPACGKSPDPALMPGADITPQVSRARILLPPPGASMAAGYFEVSNPGAEALELRAVSCPSFGSVEMHETQDEGGMSRMRQIRMVEIPAGGSASFEPGAKHLMLMGSKLDADKPVRELPMTLEFVAPDGSKQVVNVPFAVESATGGAAQTHH